MHRLLFLAENVAASEGKERCRLLHICGRPHAAVQVIWCETSVKLGELFAVRSKCAVLDFSIVTWARAFLDVDTSIVSGLTSFLRQIINRAQSHKGPFLGEEYKWPWLTFKLFSFLSIVLLTLYHVTSRILQNTFTKCLFRLFVPIVCFYCLQRAWFGCIRALQQSWGSRRLRWNNTSKEHTGYNQHVQVVPLPAVALWRSQSR